LRKSPEIILAYCGIYFVTVDSTKSNNVIIYLAPLQDRGQRALRKHDLQSTEYVGLCPHKSQRWYTSKAVLREPENLPLTSYCDALGYSHTWTYM